MVTLLTLAGLAMWAGQARLAGVLLCMAAAAHWNTTQEPREAPPQPRPVCTDVGIGSMKPENETLRNSDLASFRVTNVDVH